MSRRYAEYGRRPVRGRTQSPQGAAVWTPDANVVNRLAHLRFDSGLTLSMSSITSYVDKLGVTYNTPGANDPTYNATYAALGSKPVAITSRLSPGGLVSAANVISGSPSKISMGICWYNVNYTGTQVIVESAGATSNYFNVFTFGGILNLNNGARGHAYNTITAATAQSLWVIYDLDAVVDTDKVRVYKAGVLVTPSATAGTNTGTFTTGTFAVGARNGSTTGSESAFAEIVVAAGGQQLQSEWSAYTLAQYGVA